MKSFRAVVMASGRGSNFRALVEAAESGRFLRHNIEFVVQALIVDRPHTGAEEFALSRSIPVTLIDYKSIADRSTFDRKLEEHLLSLSFDSLFTLGFMRILPSSIVRNLTGRIINIHPSLLPAFPGMNAQRQAFRYGAKITGCTVHYLDEGVDTGPVIMQTAVNVPSDCKDEDQLADIILKEEHRTLIDAVELHVRGLLKIEGRKVEIKI